MAYNGCPSGFENECEDAKRMEILKTPSGMCCMPKQMLFPKQLVLHTTAKELPYTLLCRLVKIVANWHQAGISRLVYLNAYKDTSGIDFLRKAGVEVVHFTELDNA